MFVYAPIIYLESLVESQDSRGSHFMKMAGFNRLPVYAGDFWILLQKQRLEILVFCLHPDYPRVMFLKWINVLEYILQHTATHCKTLQQPATHSQHTRAVSFYSAKYSKYLCVEIGS